MFKIFSLFFLIVSCGFKSPEEVQESKNTYGLTTHFTKRVLAETDLDLFDIQNISLDMHSNAPADIPTEGYLLGEVSPDDRLYILLSPGLLFGQRFEYTKERDGVCSLELFLPSEFKEQLDLKKNFEEILKWIYLRIGHSEYVLKDLYNNRDIEVSLNDFDGQSNLQIVVRDFHRIKRFDKKQEKVYLKLFPIRKFDLLGGFKIEYPYLSEFHTINPIKYRLTSKGIRLLTKCLRFFVNIAKRDGVGFVPLETVRYFDSGNLYPMNELKKKFRSLISNTEEVEHFQNYSLDIHAIIAKPKKEEL